MAIYFMMRSNQYARMSLQFYENYLLSKKRFDEVEIDVPAWTNPDIHIALSAQ